MTADVNDYKAELVSYLRTGREAVLWKLDGVSEYDARRPLVPTGTNLLGLVKHLAGVEGGYFGVTFGRPFPEKLVGYDDDDPDEDFNADLWVTAEETREDILGLYERVTAFADRTIEELPLETLGRVPWWRPETAETSLHRILVHVIAETHRHVGHMDIVRETIDGFAGLRVGNDNLWKPADGWPAHHERLEQLAQRFR